MKVAELFESRQVPQFGERFCAKEPLPAETYTLNPGHVFNFEPLVTVKYPLHFVKEWKGKYIVEQWNPSMRQRDQYLVEIEGFHKKTVSFTKAIAKHWLQSLVDKDDLNEEEEEWPENTVVRVTAHEFEANRTVDPQEHMRRQRMGQYGLPRAVFKKDTLLVITGYTDNGRSWDVLFDYFDEKKRGANYFVSSWYHFRKAVEKDDKAWINSLKEEEEDEEPKECWVKVGFYAAYADHGSVGIRFDPHDQLVFYKYSKTGKAWFGDGTGRTYKVEREVFDACVTFDKRDAGKNWLDSLKEETEDKPSFQEFDQASDLAIAFYQQLCDEHWNEQKHYVTPSDEYQGPNVTISTDEHSHYWNPATGEFILHVIDSARGSCDDGIHVKVLTSGRVLATEMPKTNPLERMTDNPAILAKIKERQGKSRNRFIEFNPDDL